MPVYNAGEFLKACIDSIRAQNFVEWELIAVDDFSTDESLSILSEFKELDSRIHVFENSKKGIVPALEKAFSHAVGNYISRMDADDIMPVFKLKELYQVAQKRERLVATGLVEYFSDQPVSEGYRRYEKWLNSVARDGTFSQNIYRECVIASPNWMVHRSCFDEKISLENLTYPEDYDLVLKMHHAGYTFESVDKITHLWREHPQRTSRNSDIYQQESFFALKTTFFIQHHLNREKHVQLIGASQKGKLVAKILRDNKISFDWFEYNLKESSQNLKDTEKLVADYPSILTNWPLNEQVQHEIRSYLRAKNFEFGKNLWLF